MSAGFKRNQPRQARAKAAGCNIQQQAGVVGVVLCFMPWRTASWISRSSSKAALAPLALRWVMPASCGSVLRCSACAHSGRRLHRGLGAAQALLPACAVSASTVFIDR